jgi:hypothetical protein
MILRGFAQASQFMHIPIPSTKDHFPVRKEIRKASVSRPSTQRSLLPSRSEILAQFGPQLGSDIVKYVSQKGAFDDSSIEPAWRVPYIPSTEPRRRPIFKSSVLQPEPERSPSPDNAHSIWAATDRSAPRNNFTEHEDGLLLDFVADARRQGLDLSSQSTWKQLEAKVNPKFPVHYTPNK